MPNSLVWSNWWFTNLVHTAATPSFGKCSCEECLMFQHYDVCPRKLSAKLLFMVNSDPTNQRQLQIFGRMLESLAHTNDVSEQVGMQLLARFPMIPLLSWVVDHIILSYHPSVLNCWSYSYYPSSLTYWTSLLILLIIIIWWLRMI